MKQSKAIAGGVAGAVATLIVVVANRFLEVPLGIEIHGAIAVVVGYIVPYFAPANR